MGSEMCIRDSAISGCVTTPVETDAPDHEGENKDRKGEMTPRGRAVSRNPVITT